MWSPLVIAYVAQRFNERFGQGSASYVEVRDRFVGAELDGWLAYFGEWDRHKALAEAQSKHDSVMKAAAEALRPH